MASLGRKPGAAPLTSSDIPDNSITAAKIVADTIVAGDIADDAVGTAELANDVVISTSGAIAGTGGLTIDGATVFNEASADVDFRVESNTDTHGLFLQGSDGFIGIGTNAPAKLMSVDGDALVGSILYIASNTDVGGGWNLQRVNSNEDLQISRSSGSTRNLIFTNVGSGACNVGIGTAAPNGVCTVYGAGRVLSLQNSTTGTGASDGSYFSFSGSDLQIANGENAAMKFYTNDTERMTIDKDGLVGIGTTSPSALLEAQQSAAYPSLYGGNTYSSTGGVGVYGTGHTAVKGNGSHTVGYDFYAGGYGTNYGPFTGGHDGLYPRDETLPEIGDIIVDVEIVSKRNISNCIFKNGLSSTTNQSAIGIFTSKQDHPMLKELELDEDDNPIEMSDQERKSNIPSALSELSVENINELDTEYYRISFNAVGEGQVNVSGENGDIAIGDLIVTSSVAGKGMKQDDNIIKSTTVAKARETITFASSTEVIQIACVYLCG